LGAEPVKVDVLHLRNLRFTARPQNQKA
jgi:hypothetical protein